MLRVAVCQRNGQKGKIEENLKVVELLVAEHSKEADLFCFPELYREGYACAKQEFFRLAETQDGPSSLRLRACANEHGVYIAYGYTEKGCDGELYNAGQIVSPEGNLLLNYRKTHLYDPLGIHERAIFKPGDSFSDIVEIKGIPCAMLICWDIEIPEISRVLALRGARCFIVLTANGSDITNSITVRSRAVENNSFVIYVNRVGSDPSDGLSEDSFYFNGQSAVYGPDGSILSFSSKTEEDFDIVELDSTKEDYLRFVARNPLILDRRPELYDDLVLK